jgi:hypothetical protein
MIFRRVKHFQVFGTEVVSREYNQYKNEKRFKDFNYLRIYNCQLQQLC